MKDLGKVFRLAMYVCALPLAITAVASAHNMMGIDEVTPPLTIESGKVVMESDIYMQRAHVLVADTAGNFHGRVVQFENNAEGLKVFFIRNGDIEQSTMTDANGHFEVTDLTAGPYSFVAAGQNGFVAHGTYVTTDAEVASEQVISMHTAAVAPTYEPVTTFIAQHPVTNAPVIDVDSTVDSLEISQLSGGNKIQITKDGQLVGRVVALAHRLDQSISYTTTAAQLIDSNQQARDVFVDANGNFTVSDIQPGVYDFVAAGENGFAAVGFEAVAYQENEEEVAPTLAVQNASYATAVQDFCCNGCQPQLDICMTAPVDCGIVYEQVQFADECCIVEEAPIIEEEIVYEEPIAIDDVGCGCATGCNMGCGGFHDFGGGGGGGGGFGGGLGGLDIGGLVGAAIGAFVISEVIDEIDDDDDVGGGVIAPPTVLPPAVIPPVVTPPPTSPF